MLHFGMPLSAIQSLTDELGEPRYRATQAAEWLYKHHASSVHQMRNIPAALREKLAPADDGGIPAAEPAERHRSSDGTVRYAFAAYQDGGGARGAKPAVYETAVIPDGRRTTLCVSVQAGCAVGCRFCLTGHGGLNADLRAGEILSQYRNISERDAVTNIVYMGMGEPAHNLDAVLRSLEVFTAAWGYGFSPRRVTVSTVGVLPELERLLDATETNIALSLHAARPEVRMELVPTEHRYSAAEIVELLKNRHRLSLPPFRDTGRRRLSFELVMLAGVNDSARDAAALVKLIGGLPCRVNLIPWNGFPGARYAPAPREQTERFQTTLKDAGIMTTIRKSRGQEIGAACGLLAGRRDG